MNEVILTEIDSVIAKLRKELARIDARYEAFANPPQTATATEILGQHRMNLVAVEQAWRQEREPIIREISKIVSLMPLKPIMAALPSVNYES